MGGGEYASERGIFRVSIECVYIYIGYVCVYIYIYRVCMCIYIYRVYIEYMQDKYRVYIYIIYIFIEDATEVVVVRRI